MTEDHLKLLGAWITDPDLLPEDEEPVQIDFHNDGRCTLTILGEFSDKKSFLTYRVENGILVTDQPSDPREEKTQFYFTADGKLVLIYDNKMTQYVRLNSRDSLSD